MTNKHTVNTTAESDKVSIATQGDMHDPIEVEGTPGRIAKFATATTLTDSIITESAGRIGIGTATPNAPPATLNVTVTDGSVGVLGESTTTAGVGVMGRSAGPGIIGSSPNFPGVFGSSASGNGVAGSSNSGHGVFGGSASGHGVEGFSGSGNGVYGESAGFAAGVEGFNSSIGGFGVWGRAAIGGSGYGVYGSADRGNGVTGTSTSAFGVLGSSTSHVGVAGYSNDYLGVLGYSAYSTGVVGSSTFGYAGEFIGDVLVTGRLSKGGGGFMIDHPIHPTTKTLAHSFVESPDMMNVYNGNVTTDANGEASVTLPDYFEALNQDFRYQLTVIGQFAQAIVAEEIRSNQFTIKTDQPRVKVSWQVTGIRQDPWAVAHRITAEEEKAAADKGRYMHPEQWGQPEEARMHRSPPRIDRFEEPPQIDRARLEEARRQVEELAQRMHQREPWKEGEGPTSPESL